MDSWSYVSEGKGFAFEEAVSTPDSFSRNRNVLMGWEPKYHSCYGNNIQFSNQLASENHQGIAEIGFPEMMRKELLNDSIGDVSSSKDGGGGRMVTPSMATPNAFPGKDDSTSKLSSFVAESNSRDSLLIDLKLGRFVDYRDLQNSKSFKGTNFSSAESSMPAKRIRSAGLNASNAFCQVYGCNKDLSGSKEYHKRHKVCEAHSKTAKVIVNGIEQRFCQQCSRFHLLGEFDDGKRSCRKRLAGHNERRRKPQVGIHSGRTGRLLQSYNGLAGSRLHGSTLTASSFICPDILPSGLLRPEEYGTNDWCKRIKVEDGMDFSPPSAIPITNGHLHLKTTFPPYSSEKQYPHFNENGAITASGSILSENSSQYPHNPSGSNYGSRSLFQDSSLGSEELAVFDTASTAQGLSAFSSTGCALSLLSSQSQNSSSHSSVIPMAQPLNTTGGHMHYSMSRVSERLLGVSSQASMSGISTKIPSSGMTAGEGNHLNPIMVSDGCSAVNFEVTEGIFQRPDFVNGKDCLSCEDGPTINLLQLSSQLQRVEHQRHSIQGKPENDAFCGLRIT